MTFTGSDEILKWEGFLTVQRYLSAEANAYREWHAERVKLLKDSEDPQLRRLGKIDELLADPLSDCRELQKAVTLAILALQNKIIWPPKELEEDGSEGKEQGGGASE